MKRRWVSLNRQWASGLGAGFPVQESWVENSWVSLWSARSFFLLRSTIWVPGSPRDWVLKSKGWTPSIKRGCKVFFKSKSFKLNMTNWPCHVWLQKKLVWPTNKADLGMCCQLFCTNLGDGILCILLPNHNTHRSLSATDNECFKAKKCVGNAFSCKQSKNSIFGKKRL